MPKRSLSLRRKRCLLREAQDDPRHFTEFYDAYARRILVYLNWRVGNAETAFDLMSETFAKALENRQQFRGDTAEEEQGWLFAIARSELSHYWRRGAVERAALAKLGVPVPELTSTEIERIDELAAVAAVRPHLQRALESLPDDQRRAVELRVVAEQDYAHVAAAMGVTEEAARARVSRGLRTLARQLKEGDVMLEETA